MGRKAELTNVANYSFEDLFDMQGIQKLQEAIAKAVGMGLEMVTPDGRSVTKNSIACDFCHKVVRSSEQGRRNCRISDEIIGRPNKDGPTIAPCISAGLLDAGVSIIIGDTHVGSWLLGQVRDADTMMSDEENRKRAEELGIDPDWYCKELAKVPVMTREQFTNIVNLVYVVAMQLSELGLKNYLKNEEIRRGEELQTQLTYINRHDSMTGLFNRVVYEEKVKELEESGMSPISVIAADANYLKLSNDIFGHEEGDKLLKQIGDTLQSEAKSEYVVCRCGGDEFYILMPGVDKAEAKAYVKRVRESFKIAHATVLPPSIAIGIETKESAQLSLDKVIQWAEDRMYQDKNRIKKESNMLNEIRKILYETGYLSEEVHERQVGLAEAFADYLGFDDYRKTFVRRIMKIINLGLIAVPLEELAAAEEFTDYMFEVKYGITEIEYRLSKMFDECLPVASVIAQRREQWDGNGRPNGVKGEELDLLTRFLALTDYYIMLTETGKHGFGHPHEVAMQEINQKAGTVLDPVLTGKFIEFMKQYKQ